MYVDTGQQPPGLATGMRVSPEKVDQLGQALEALRDTVREWLFLNHRRLADIPPPGNDPCSRDTVEVLGMNGSSAVAAVNAYVAELAALIAKLHESAVAYGVTEETNVAEFRSPTP